jgi:hypothetical protein
MNEKLKFTGAKNVVADRRQDRKTQGYDVGVKPIENLDVFGLH